MNVIKDNRVSFGMVGAGFALVALLYGRMPQVVPTHWNVHGVADGFMPKPLGPFVLPLLAAGTLALLIVLRVASPKGWSVERFARTYGVLTAVISGFLLVLTALTSAAAIGLPVDVALVTCLATGVLLVVLGNYMGKLRRNFFIGIRTPWTLANPEVGYRTHRLGGKLFVAAGVITLGAALTGYGIQTLLVTVISTSLVAVVYSYRVYRAVEQENSASPGR
jgi:uncharacterized membrane protein